MGSEMSAIREVALEGFSVRPEGAHAAPSFLRRYAAETHTALLESSHVGTYLHCGVGPYVAREGGRS